MTYANIYFKHTTKPGSNRRRMDKINVILEPSSKWVRFLNMSSESHENLFDCFQHERFEELTAILEDWNRRGIESSITHGYYDPDVWRGLREHVFSEDGNVHWQVLLGHDDDTCSVYVHLGTYFPKELWSIYKIAEGMRPKKERRPAILGVDF